MIIKPGTMVVASSSAADSAPPPVVVMEFSHPQGCEAGDHLFAQSGSSMGMTSSNVSGTSQSSIGLSHGSHPFGRTAAEAPLQRSVSSRALEMVPPPGFHPAAGARILLPTGSVAGKALARVPPPAAAADVQTPTDASQTAPNPPVPQGTRLRDPNDKGAKQLIVKFLAPQVTEAELRALFQQFGPVEYSRMIYDSVSGASKGYGFIYYYRSADAAEAVAGMDSFELYGRYLRVGFAIPQRQPPAPPPLPGSA